MVLTLQMGKQRCSAVTCPRSNPRWWNSKAEDESHALSVISWHLWISKFEFLWNTISLHKFPFSSVQLLSRVWLFATPWTAALQASLSITNSQSLLKLMSFESVMPSNHPIFCCPLLLPHSMFPSIRVLSKSQFFASGGLNIGVSASASVLLMNIQDWFPLGWTGWISLQS